ncbi:MAG: Molybdopterin dinucleotide-binding region [Methanomicrobiales archaeon 53_19]|jgi:formylmethanofuran dehydrogenase subunit D|uniref:molybdopterin dinucleotide binding domain-containing protein n=1 Tax=Methanocalculus sp. TaxID=2004547 RepID=UPI0007488912|nr:molybdopterin dinucleotide binding domain-containing protein [Methanocalculus sp.]KUK71087.1 MAG: Molybdopterin dinucleotide-binding region [Methanocalculus sp. 52_23]KUL03941.1 MAG: Molybdopterin dinucleotide-binding region [Methanomicrobiales archaeon 53_19]HIJ06329.1 molybdopterin dinucleotide-binding protein [Methanocalculus sp.]
MRLTLSSGRTIPQGSFVEHKLSKGYQRATSIVYINHLDLMELGIESGDRVQVTSDSGSVVLITEATHDIPTGCAYIALGPYANAIIGGYTHGTGMPDYKDIIVEIEPTDDPVPTVWDLMEIIGGLRYGH